MNTAAIFQLQPEDRKSCLSLLRQELGQCRVIHVICDNARFHRCRAVGAYLAEVDGQIRLHFLHTCSRDQPDGPGLVAAP